MKARRRLGFAVALTLSLTACVTRPIDPFVSAERALLQHDLARALQALDAVPVAHARYPQARASAVDVERDMRRCHELMLEAMLFRAEWRDDEALAALQKVRAIWPAMPGVEVLIAATEQRRRLFAAQPRPTVTPVANVAVATQPPSAPAVESSPPTTAGATGSPTTGPAPVSVPPGEDSVALGLVAVELRLGRGHLEGAVVDLLELARRFPADPRVRGRLVRLLHQRALLRYGDGQVAMAIADWQRVVELDPAHRGARRMLDAAAAESR